MTRFVIEPGGGSAYRQLYTQLKYALAAGVYPPGVYIGRLHQNGIEYQYFQDSSGGYWYRRWPEYDPEKNK